MVAIALHEKRVQWEDAPETLPPSWLLSAESGDIEPTLVVGTRVILGYAAILDYLEDVGAIEPLRTRIDAKARGWFIISEHLIDQLRNMMMARSSIGFRSARAKLAVGLAHINDRLGNSMTISRDGSGFGYADMLVAPVLCYVDAFLAAGIMEPLASTDRVSKYVKRVVSRPSVAATQEVDLEVLVDSDLPGKTFQTLFSKRTGFKELDSGVRRAAKSRERVDTERPPAPSESTRRPLISTYIKHSEDRSDDAETG